MKYNGELKDLRNKIEGNHLELLGKIGEIEVKMSSIETKLDGFPCMKHSEKIEQMEQKINFAIGGMLILGLLLTLKQLGIW